MTNETDGLRIHATESENYMGTENTKIDIGGRSFIISGPNEAGKSRLISLLLSGLDTKNQPSEVITKGQEKAWTKVVLAGEVNGNEQEYTVELFFTQKNKSGRIVLTDKDGNKVNSPKEILKGLIGNISFDIFTFLNDTKANKIKILKELSGVRVEIDKIDMERKKIFDDRTFLKRKVDEDEAVMNNHGMTSEEIDLYSEPIIVEPIQAEMDGISKKITDYNTVKTKTAQFRNEASMAGQRIENAHQTIEDLKEQIKSIEGDIDQMKIDVSDNIAKADKGDEWLKNNTEPNAQDISKRLSDANVHNTKHEKVKALAERQKALLQDKQKVIEQTSKIEKLDADKEKLIAGSKLPIKGLKFSDDEILYNGLPMEESQINTATLYDIGFEIAAALNPKLKVIFIKAASLYDTKHLQETIRKARAKGYQVIAEKVSDGDKLEINFIESEC